MMNSLAANDDASKWKSRRWVEISDAVSNSHGGAISNLHKAFADIVT